MFHFLQQRENKELWQPIYHVWGSWLYRTSRGRDRRTFLLFWRLLSRFSQDMQLIKPCTLMFRFFWLYWVLYEKWHRNQFRNDCTCSDDTLLLYWILQRFWVLIIIYFLFYTTFNTCSFHNFRSGFNIFNRACWKSPPKSCSIDLYRSRPDNSLNFSTIIFKSISFLDKKTLMIVSSSLSGPY